jgi:hypothetical protein
VEYVSGVCPAVWSAYIFVYIEGYIEGDVCVCVCVCVLCVCV